jgi:hypothetical protein
VTEKRNQFKIERDALALKLDRLTIDSCKLTVGLSEPARNVHTLIFELGTGGVLAAAGARVENTLSNLKVPGEAQLTSFLSF